MDENVIIGKNFNPSNTIMSSTLIVPRKKEWKFDISFDKWIKSENDHWNYFSVESDSHSQTDGSVESTKSNNSGTDSIFPLSNIDQSKNCEMDMSDGTAEDLLLEGASDEDERDPGSNQNENTEGLIETREETQLVSEEAFFQGNRPGHFSQLCTSDSTVNMSSEDNSEERASSSSVVRNQDTEDSMNEGVVQIKSEDTSHDSTELEKLSQFCTNVSFIKDEEPEDESGEFPSNFSIQDQSIEELMLVKEVEIKREDACNDSTELKEQNSTSSDNFELSRSISGASTEERSENDLSEDTLDAGEATGDKSEELASGFMLLEEVQIKIEDTSHNSIEVKKQNCNSSDNFDFSNSAFDTTHKEGRQKPLAKDTLDEDDATENASRKDVSEKTFAKDTLDAGEVPGNDYNKRMCTNEILDNVEELRGTASAEESLELLVRTSNVTREGEIRDTDIPPPACVPGEDNPCNKQTEANNEDDKTTSRMSSENGSPLKTVIHSNAARRAYLRNLKSKIESVSAAYNNFRNIIPFGEESSKKQVGNKSTVIMDSNIKCKPHVVYLQKLTEQDLKNATSGGKKVKSDDCQPLMDSGAKPTCSNDSGCEAARNNSGNNTVLYFDKAHSIKQEKISEISNEESTSTSSSIKSEKGAASTYYCPHCKTAIGPIVSGPETEKNNNVVPEPLNGSRSEILLELFSTDNVLSRNIILALMDPDFKKGATTTELLKYLKRTPGFKAKAKLKEDMQAFLSNAVLANALRLKRYRYYLAEVSSEVAGKTKSVKKKSTKENKQTDPKREVKKLKLEEPAEKDGTGKTSGEKSSEPSDIKKNAFVLLNQKEDDKLENRKRKLEEVCTVPEQVFKHLRSRKVLKHT